MIVEPQPSRKSLGQNDMQEGDVQAGSVTAWQMIVTRTIHRPTLPDGACVSYTDEQDAVDIDGSTEDYLVEM
jgi:hypothetical protein